MNLLLIMIGIGVGLAGIFFVVILLLGKPAHQRTLLAEVTSEAYRSAAVGETGLRPASKLEIALKPLTWVRKLFGGGPNPEIARRLSLAGYRKPFHADVFVGAKLILPAITGLTIAYFVKDNVIFLFFIGVFIAFFLPDFWLGYAIQKRRERIERGLPDTLDLLAICMEAGLGLDQAVVRVGQELRLSHPELSEELLQINLEQRAGNPRIGAWRAMANRVGVDSVRSFVNMLVQTERFGTPISKSLAAFSDSLRTQRRQKAEELAAKTTIKLVFPLVLCIFPSIFIVTVAPAVITLIKSFSTFLK